MRRRWYGVAARALGAAVLGAGALGVSAAGGQGTSAPRSSSAVESVWSGIERFSELIGLEDEGSVAPGTLDDGKELLPLAAISLDQAIAAAQAATSGTLGEVDLEHSQGRLVFNVDVGEDDVKVDAATGQVLSVEQDD
jgi:hypothetical protein